MAADLVAGEVEVASVVTNDDVAVQDSLYTAGRRGVGVTVLLEKIAGARAEQGASLAEVTATAVKVNANGRSMGMGMSRCVVAAAGRRNDAAVGRPGTHACASLGPLTINSHTRPGAVR